MNILETPINESFGNELTLEDNNTSTRINLELRDIPKIDIENFDSIKEKISQKVGIEQEDDYVLLESMMGLRLSINRNIERINMSNGNEKYHLLRDFAIEDSKWMGLIAEHITLINNDPNIKKKEKLDKIHSFWRDLEKAYKDFEIYYKDFINCLEENNYSFNNDKNGILGEVTAEDLMNSINEIADEFNIKRISTEPSTPEEDVDEKIDFFINIEYSNGLSEIIPCQVKAHKNTSYAGKFILENIITKVTKNSSNELKLSRDIKNPSIVEENTIKDLERFKDKALKRYNKGIFVMIPYGKAVYRKTKKKVESINLLEENGKAHEQLKELFKLQLKEKVFSTL